jgi:hypothetical protein
MSAPAFSARLAQFKENFSKLLGRKEAGYEELSGLERPLVGRDDDDDDSHHAGQHNLAAPGQYSGPVPGYEGTAPVGPTARTGADSSLTMGQGPLPSQVKPRLRHKILVHTDT